MSTTEFGKNYDHATDKELYIWREEQGVFDPDRSVAKRASLGHSVRDEQFVIPLPPPNVTGKLHVGHALMATVQDAMARYHRMNGYRTLRVPGTDHAAISTNTVVEKKLRKEGKSRLDLGRSGFLTEVRAWVSEHRGHINNQLQLLGSSLDRNREQYTMSEGMSRAVRHAFKTLYTKGKVYEDNYVVNWSPAAQSVISDIEVEYEEREEQLYYVRYFVDTKKHVITVATTRPETMFADVALAVHPMDKRYKKFIGKKVIIPIINRTIPIIADEYVDMTFGTGALKITPAHDLNDFEVAKRHKLPMDVYAFDKDVVFTEQAGETFAGKKVADFKDNVIQYLQDIGNLDRVETYKHRVPLCERTKCRVEPLMSKQWFVDVKDTAEKLLHRLDEKELHVHPQRFTSQFTQWLEKLRPRCISRQIWWGHRLPVWQDKKGAVHVFDERDVLAHLLAIRKKSPSTETSENIVFAMIVFNLVADGRLPEHFSSDDVIDVLFGASLTPYDTSTLTSYVQMYRTRVAQGSVAEDATIRKGLDTDVTALEELVTRFVEDGDVSETAVIIMDLLDACSILQELPKQLYVCDLSVLLAGVDTLTQSEDTLDTWFSSALWPFSILGWPEKTADLSQYYPATVLETGYDIILFRVVKMMVMGEELTGQLPFEHVYFHGMVRDAKGKKMSKSFGNVMNPVQEIEQYGADALRLSLLAGSTPGNDVNYHSEKTQYYSRFVNKLWNASRFVHMRIQESHLQASLGTLEATIMSQTDVLHDFDLWVLHVLNDLTKDVKNYMDKFYLGECAHTLSQSVWQYFCDRYIEISKVHFGEMTHTVLLYVLGRLLQLLHPFAPFVTEHLWQKLGFAESIAISDWPEQLTLPAKDYKVKLMMDIITELRQLRTKVSEKHHEKVAAFVQASSDLLSYMEESEGLIKKLVNIETLDYYREGQALPDGYATGVVINITVGVQGIRQVDKKEQLASLESQLEQEKHFLQSVRTTLANEQFVANAPEAVVAAKRDKMEKVKANIQQLEMEIKRIKSGN